MAFISFAPHREDAILWHAFHDVRNGYYIDCGPPPPAPFSYTRAFDDIGWHGISLRAFAGSSGSEGVPALIHFARLNASCLDTLDFARLRPLVVLSRPSDHRLVQILRDFGYGAALTDSETHFYTAPGHDDLAAKLLQAGDGNRDNPAILRAALDIQQLRTGSAIQRLLDATIDAGRFRADAVALTAEVAWQRGLLDEMRQAEGRKQADRDWLQGQLVAVQANLAEAQAQSRALSEEAGWLKGRVAESDASVALLTAQLAEIHERLRRSEQAGDEARAQAEQFRLHAERLTVSISWRLTRPLRAVRGLISFRPPQAPAPPERARIAPPQPVPPVIVKPLPARQIAPRRPAPSPPLPVPLEGTVAIAASKPEPIVRPTQRREPQRRSWVHTVHQFHAGSAPHDAVTNSMLMIRKILRSMGFASDIFVESLHPEADPTLMSVASLPDHDGSVLLVHHSMGHPGFSHLMQRQQAMVLMYHNITPPDVIGRDAGLQDQARLGREQLALLRDRVRFALTPSAFNAAELHRLGFAAVRVCPLLFDVEDILARASGPRVAGPVFTVLFVGRVTPSKGQDALIEAFARFRHRLGRPCRLVMPGALAPTEHSYLEELRRRISTLGLDEHVSLPGLVPDAELDAWYREADLYVSLSRHEGFGIPLIEAAAYGLPILAWPTGAVPYTVGEFATMLEARDPESVASAMITAVHAVPRDASNRLRELTVAKHIPTLLLALASAGAIAPLDQVTAGAIGQNWRFLVSGTQGSAGRVVADTIERRRPGSVRRCTSDQPQGSAHPAAPDTGPELLILCDGAQIEETADLRAAYVTAEAAANTRHIPLLNSSADCIACDTPATTRTLVNSGVSKPAFTVGVPGQTASFVESLSEMAARVLCMRHSLPARITWVTLTQGIGNNPIPELIRQSLKGLAIHSLNGAVASPTTVAQIVQSDPEIIVIDYADEQNAWTGLISLLKSLAHIPIVLALENATSLRPDDDTTRELLGDLARIAVPTAGDACHLARIGFADQVLTLPRPALPAFPSGVRPVTPSSPPTIACISGPGASTPETVFKGLERLRKRWPDLRVSASLPESPADLIVFSCHPISEKQLHEAMASGVAVAATPDAYKDDWGDAVARLPGHTPAEIDLGIAFLLGSLERRQDVVNAARAWVAERAAPLLADRWADLLTNLTLQHRIGAPHDGSVPRLTPSPPPATGA